MTKILAIDTSTEACSVALHHDGEVSEEFQFMPRQHADRMLGMINTHLKRHTVTLDELDAIAFGRGPGSFTGLRIATGIVQGLTFGLDIPALPVSTLSALAYRAAQYHPGDCFLASLDARIGEVYWAAYAMEDGMPAPLHEETLCVPAEVSLDALTEERRAGTWIGVGNGWQLQEQFPPDTIAVMSEIDAEALPRAAAIAELGLMDFLAGVHCQPEKAHPLYLRDKVTQ